MKISRLKTCIAILIVIWFNIFMMHLGVQVGIVSQDTLNWWLAESEWPNKFIVNLGLFELLYAWHMRWYPEK